MFCTAFSGSKSGSIDNPTRNLLIEGGSVEARYNVKNMRRLGSNRERERDGDGDRREERVLGRVSSGESEPSRKSESSDSP